MTSQTPIDIGEFGYSNVVREVGTSIGSTLVSDESLIAQQYPDLTCACCTNKITHPQWIDRYLGGEINKYLDACSEMGQTPQVFCCNCMPAIQRNPTVMNHWREIQAQVHEFSTRLYALEQRERDIKKREEELDKQLGIS